MKSSLQAFIHVFLPSRADPAKREARERRSRKRVCCFIHLRWPRMPMRTPRQVLANSLAELVRSTPRLTPRRGRPKRREIDDAEIEELFRELGASASGLAPETLRVCRLAVFPLPMLCCS